MEHEISVTPPPIPFPAVSVIIPMYNAEKYIGECLDSILEQTLTDFEVIVVDECSTDNSVKIIKNYAPRFDGRLKLINTLSYPDNDGYTARNRGFDFSRGEYVFFMDSDDFITKTALEELYTLAKEYDADVVYTDSRYRYTSDEGAKLTRGRIGKELRAKGIADEPILTENDPHKNLQELLVKAKLYWTPWTKFVKKNFLADNEISFYEIISGADFIWTIELFACAKRFLRIPNAVYYWRNDSTIAAARKYKGVKEKLYFDCSGILAMKDSLSMLADKLDILKTTPEYVRLAFNLYFAERLKRINKTTLKLTPEQVYEALRSRFTDKNNEDLTVPLLFSIIDSQQKELDAAQQRITELEDELKRKE